MEKISASVQRVQKIYQYYKDFTPFTDKEAWALFRIAAIAEAVGWMLLISGIIIRNYVWIDNGFTVPIAGRIHGMLFVVYIIAVLVLAPTLRWSFLRIIIAGAASTPPFGSLLFEQWEAYRRRRHAVRNSTDHRP